MGYTLPSPGSFTSRNSLPMIFVHGLVTWKNEVSDEVSFQFGW